MFTSDELISSHADAAFDVGTLRVKNPCTLSHDSNNTILSFGRSDVRALRVEDLRDCCVCACVCDGL